MAPVLHAFLLRRLFSFDFQLCFSVENGHEVTTTPTNDANAPIEGRVKQGRHNLSESATPTEEIDCESKRAYFESAKQVRKEILLILVQLLLMPKNPPEHCIE